MEATGLGFQNTIHHHIHRLATGLDEVDCSLQQRPAVFSLHSRQNDQTGMNLLFADQLAKVTGVLCDENAVLLQARLDDPMVRLLATPDMQRMHSIMAAAPVEPQGEFGPERLVDEQPQA